MKDVQQKAESHYAIRVSAHEGYGIADGKTTFQMYVEQSMQIAISVSMIS